MSNKTTFFVKTLGCKANYSDGQMLEVGLNELGFESSRDLYSADVVVVNSCTVTDEADKQSQRWVKAVHKKNPNAKIIYTGCAAEVNPDRALKIKGVSAVVGNQDKLAAATMIKKYLNSDQAIAGAVPVILGGVQSYDEIASKHPLDREWPLPDDRLEKVLKLGTESSTFRTRVFLKIQEGCDSFCTYCIIPYGRGPARSLPIESIVEKIKILVDQGIHEVILTGTNIGDYGVDLHSRMMIDDLIESILTKTNLKRLRVSSLDPTEISPRMIEMMESIESFCPHFHVSLQHVNSKILKLMKRKYSYPEVEETLGRIQNMKRRPFVGMDFITGFPGESDADFHDSVEVLKKLSWSRLHVFPYSERAGTPATKLPHSVAPSTRKKRAQMLQALSLERLTKQFSDRRSKNEELIKGVLLEGRMKGPDGTTDWVSGYSSDYQRVILPLKTPEKMRSWNKIIDVAVNRWVVDRASGEVSWMIDKAMIDKAVDL